ncbi:MAG: sigma-54-dependent Fis family transcriptional regulator [bacterium]|nr:sigma-54-dependent Fis family transcriptional regulator [bacterium]
MSNNVLVLILDPSPCAAHGCEQLGEQLRSLLPAEVEVRARDRIPRAPLTPAPDLIVVRSTSSVIRREQLRGFEDPRRPTPILGVFCSQGDNAGRVVRSLSRGVNDFLCCPIQRFDLLPRIQRLLPDSAGRPRSRKPPELEALVGESEPFLRQVDVIPRLAATDATVMISGETGTGKELVARAIHYHSRRRGKPFVPLNCSALPETLVENELFGHAKGAYTNASSVQRGLVEEARGGTLFLDEVDTLSLSVQVKMLRFLQDLKYRPLGAARSRSADVRILAATNADLRQAVALRRFRADLFYRLNVLRLRLPPLRERSGDVPLLAAHFLSLYGRQYQRPMTISARAMDKLSAYSWPGNVRELKAVLQRAMLLSTETRLEPHDLDLPASVGGGTTPRRRFQEAKALVIAGFERDFLARVLAAHQGNVTRAAKSAGKERRAFQRLLHKHRIDPRDFLS